MTIKAPQLSNITYEGLLTEATEGKKAHLPKRPMISFDEVDGNYRHVVVTLSKEAVCENMQTNAAAFESWILALKAWGVIDRALLKWDKPLDGVGTSKWCHYQRFLYRVGFFQKLFGDWFDVESIAELNSCEVFNPKNDGMLILNIPDKDKHGIASSSKEEALLETAFARTPGLLGERFSLFRLNRQLPVGLFLGAKAKGSRIFTGGASAIDLVGEDGNGGLWIFELKKKGNTALGVITELMLYAACMCDLRSGKFRLHDGQAGKRWNGDIRNIAKHGRVNAVFLLPEIHPLFNDQKKCILQLLNNACERTTVDIRFHLQEFSYETCDGADSHRSTITLK